MKILEPDRIDTIVLHCSDSFYGDIEVIDSWHKDNGWIMSGYHYIITNCFPKHINWFSKTPVPSMDGKIHESRPEEFQGAHVLGHNNHSLGVCMIGRHGQFTSKQLYSAVEVCLDLIDAHPTIRNIKGHTELDNSKTCPDLDMTYFRSLVNKARNSGEICLD